jgi:hypothetical protein
MCVCVCVCVCILQEERAATKRMNVLARRWLAGVYRQPDKSVLKGEADDHKHIFRGGVGTSNKFAHDHGTRRQNLTDPIALCSERVRMALGMNI